MDRNTDVGEGGQTPQVTRTWILGDEAARLLGMRNIASVRNAAQRRAAFAFRKRDDDGRLEYDEAEVLAYRRRKLGR
jgi:hypothetical protein